MNAGRFSGVSDGGIADVTTTFGALTSAGFGGVPVDGTSITAGDPGGHWEINGAGHLVPTGVGTLLGSYDLVTDTGQGVMVTITANEISARSETEIRDALLTASGGETVRLRNTGFAVPTVPLRLAENMNYASLVTLTREPGAVIQNLQVQAAVNLTLSNLDIHEINGSMVESALDLLGACDNVIVEDCDIHGVYRDPFGDYSDGSYANTFYGINCGFSNGSEPLSLTIRRNRIYDCRQGAIFIVEGAGGLTITDNEFYQLYTDGFQLAARDGGKDAPMVVERNYLHGFIGLGSDVGDPHVDAIQFASGQTITYSKVEIRQNIIKADLTESRAPAIQGITLFNHANTVTLKDAVIAGNVILTGGTNALVMSTMDGGVVVNNTVGVSALGAPDNGTGAIELGTIGSSGTIYVHNNIAEQVSLQGGATYDQGGNVELGDEGSTIAYATAFDGPAFTNPISFDQVKSRYAMKTGGPADHGGQNAGALNSGYGSFGAPRTASGWSHDPAYESFAPTVAPPPSVPDHWWDFSDAAQRSMSGDEITALSDKQGSGVDLSFASGERPELLNGRAALFDGTAQATFAAPFNIDADAHTLMLFGHLPGDNAQRAVLSGDQPWFITGLDSSNGATPSKVYALSSGARTGSVLEFSSYQFSAAYSDAAIIGNGVFYSASGPTEHVLGNGETTETMAALGTGVSAATYFGGWIDGNAANRMYGMITGAMYFTRKLDTTEIAAMLDWARLHYGTFDAATKSRVIICDGDSTTVGFGAPEPARDNWVARMGATYDLAGARLVNAGKNGDTLTADTSLPRTTTALTTHAAFAERVVVLLKGSNDIWNGRSAAQVIADIDTALAALRSHDPGATLIGATIFDRQNDDPDRAAVNAHILGSADFDQVVDLAGDARLSDASDPTYFDADLIHLTQAGNGVVAELMAAAL